VDWDRGSDCFIPYAAALSYQNQPHQFSRFALFRPSQKDHSKWLEAVYARQVPLLLCSSLAVVRQAYGFTTYTQLLAYFENWISKSNKKINKFLNYSVSAVSAKLLAMIFEAPLTLIKTRV
jgi:hypothetical protein